jgi:soluble lytic murein transglycosylase-like protein
MSSLRYNPPYDEQTTASNTGGCLSGFLLPPLAVMVLGAFMAFILLSASPASTPAVRAAPAAQSASGTQAVASDSVVSSLPASLASVGSGIAQVFRPEVMYWSSKIRSWAAEAGLDPNLVATVMQIESCGYQKAISRAGAIGLFQVMPYHFASGDDPYDPDTNALRGLAYLKRSLAAANGNIRLALAGYNGGIGVIARPESAWSSQTQNYAAVGSRIYSEAAATLNNGSQPKQWGTGSALCQQAAAMEGINP